MKLVFLGCGTSTGVPVIGCRCETCSSSDLRNRRTRSSLLIECGSKNILIDTSTDLRAQSLANGVERIDAVLYTHYHADHILGIDELRSFNRIQNEEPIPCYGDAPTIASLTHSFEYIFSVKGPKNLNGWKPNLTANLIDGPFELFGEQVLPVSIKHGKRDILGFRIGDAAYLTDCSAIPPESMEIIKGVKVLILGALRNSPHPTHFSIPEAIEASREAGAGRTILTHLGHYVDYNMISPELPDGVELACDGLVVDLA